MPNTFRKNAFVGRSIALVLASALLSAGPAQAQDNTVVLRFAHFVPSTHELGQSSFPQWMKSVEAASGGTIKIREFPAGQLGKPTDHYDLARDGIADIAWVNPSMSAGRFPIFAVSQLPMIVADSGAGSRALTEWYRRFEKQEMGDVKVCFAHMMYGDMLHTKTKVASPSDLQGLKIRPSSSPEATLVRLAGGAAVPGGNPHAREMIERGVVDGTMSTPSSLIAFGADKVVKYHLNLALSQPAWVLVINKSKYESLSPKQMHAIDANCDADAAYRFTKPLIAFEATGISTLAKTNTVIEPTDAEIAQWRVLADQVKTEWAQEVSGRGLDPKAIYDSFMAEVEKHGAGM